MHKLILGTRESVPECEERLRVVGLEAPILVVNVVVQGVVGENHLERIERKSVTTVVVDGLHGGKGVQNQSLSRAETRQDSR